MSDGRPTPEQFLELIEKSKRGRLKIYIGHAAGTGKTVQMLREGNDLLARGTRVVAAYIETHGRKNTEAEIRSVPVVPRKMVQYMGSVLDEMDVDEVLRLQPEVALVDELAHTNAPGSRNKKRYQDVDDLLDAGISVITALNIQHIESLNAVVEKITGVRVQETVPDNFLEQADQIVNLDLSSRDLRERIQRGEVYAPEKVDRALNNFFTTQNLSNLRELALREVAHFLDNERRERSRHGHAIAEANATPASHGTDTERALLSPLSEVDVDPVVMVATSSRPPDIRSLLRKAAAIANRLNTHWYFVYVDTPRQSTDNIDAGTQRILYNNIGLAKDLGATVVRLRGSDVAKALAEFAREYGVTHAIFGAPAPAVGLRRIVRAVRPDIISRFSSLTPGIDVHVVGLK